MRNRELNGKLTCNSWNKITLTNTLGDYRVKFSLLCWPNLPATCGSPPTLVAYKENAAQRALHPDALLARAASRHLGDGVGTLLLLLILLSGKTNHLLAHAD